MFGGGRGARGWDLGYEWYEGDSGDESWIRKRDVGKRGGRGSAMGSLMGEETASV